MVLPWNVWNEGVRKSWLLLGNAPIGRGIRVAKVSRIAGIAVAATLLCGAAGDDDPIWRPAGPFGGNLFFVQAGAEPGRLYGSTFGGLGFASMNGGDHWTPLPWITAGSGASADLAVPLAADLDDGETVYFRTRIGDSERLWRSRDGGSHFVPIETGLDLSSRFSLGLAVDPSQSTHLLLATSNGLFTSTDRGDAWRLAAFPGSSVAFVAFDPRRPAHVALTVDRDGPDEIWRSGDFGGSWSRCPTPPRWISIGRVAWSQTEADTFYLTANGRPFVAREFCASFTPLPIGRRDVWDLVGLGDGTLLAGTPAGVFRSEDGGLSWERSGPESGDPERSPLPIFQLQAERGTLDGAYVAGLAGLFRSEDSGRSWSPASRGIRALSTEVLVGGARPQIVFRGVGIFRLTAAGWRDSGTGPVVRLDTGRFSVGDVRLVAVDPADPDSLLANVGHVLAGSHDGGRSWRTLVPEPPAGSLNFTAKVAVFAPGDPRRVYVAGITSIGLGHGPEPALYRSLDRGATWTGANAFADLRALAVDPRDPNVIYAAAEGRFAVSRNGGRHWRWTGQGLPTGFGSLPQALRIDPENPDRLLLANQDQVWQSLDRGATFQPLGQDFPDDSISGIEIDTTGVYLSVVRRGIFRYDSTSRRWEPLGRRFPSWRYFGAFTLDPYHPGRLFAAIADGGLMRLDLAP